MTKLSFLQSLTLILLGHMTTAPWNMFINNQQSFEKRLAKPEDSSASILLKFNQTYCPFEFCMNQKNDNEKAWCQINLVENEEDGKIHAKIENLDPIKFNQFKSKSNSTAESDWINQSYKKYQTCSQKTVNPFVNFWASSLTSVSLIISLVSSIICATIIKYLSTFQKTKLIWSSIFIIFSANLLTTWFIYDTTIYFITELTLAILIIFIAMVFQTTLFGIFGAMGPVYVLHLMEGQGLGGVFIAVSKIFYGWLGSILKMSGNLEDSFYWVTAMAMIVLTWFLWDLVFVRLEDYKNYVKDQDASKVRLQEDQELLDQKPTKPIHANKNKISFLTILNAMKYQAASVFITFFTCLLLFPAIFSKVRDPNSKDLIGFSQINWKDLNFYLFFVFNIGDWLGKRLANYQIIKWNQSKLLLSVSVVRLLIFYPLARYGLNISGTGTGFRASPICLGMVNLVFAVSTGYFGSLAMAHCGPAVQHFFETTKGQEKISKMEIDEVKGKAQTYMLSFLMFGLLMGSLFSFWPVSVIARDVEITERELYRKFIENLFESS